MAGEDACPANVDCVGHWPTCTSACEAAGTRAWVVTTAQSGEGEACPITADSPACMAGEDACPANADCTGSWSACTLNCEASEARVWSETTAQSGNGEACPAATTDCMAGEGDCPSNADCVGEWSSCTGACEIAEARTWTEIRAHSGNGEACPAATSCAAGQGLCRAADKEQLAEKEEQEEEEEEEEEEVGRPGEPAQTLASGVSAGVVLAVAAAAASVAALGIAIVVRRCRKQKPISAAAAGPAAVVPAANAQTAVVALPSSTAPGPRSRDEGRTSTGNVLDLDYAIEAGTATERGSAEHTIVI